MYTVSYIPILSVAEFCCLVTLQVQLVCDVSTSQLKWLLFNLLILVTLKRQKPTVTKQQNSPNIQKIHTPKEICSNLLFCVNLGLLTLSFVQS
jgi:flagellar biosynthesis protein FlhB